MRFRFHVYCFVVALIVAMPRDARAGVLSYWKFDESSGLVASDTGGLVANNAVWQDATSANLSWGPGLIGNAAVLTGALGAANVFNVGSIEADGVTQLSYSVWVKPDLVQQGSGGDQANKGIFTTGTAQVDRGAVIQGSQFWGASWQDQVRFRIDSTGQVNSSNIYDGTETEPEWTHLVFTWDGTVEVPGNPSNRGTKVYVNGVLDKQGVVQALKILDDGSWQIGRDRTFSGRTFGGMIDDLVVWDEVLTDADVMAIYEGGLDGIDAILSRSIGAGCRGDVTGNCVADPADFEIIRQNFWKPINERDQGDLYDDGFINFFDYAEWRYGVQNPTPPGNASGTLSVPEPSSVLLIFPLVALCLRRRQK